MSDATRPRLMTEPFLLVYFQESILLFYLLVDLDFFSGMC